MSGAARAAETFEEWAVRDAPRDEARFHHFVPRYLAPLLPAGAEVCSVGCGSGLDVELLRNAGFAAYGFDPSRTQRFADRAEGVRDFLAIGTAQSRPFGARVFDCAYSLEVIEHVGCVAFGTVTQESTEADRLEFMEACLDLVRPGGFFLMTSSNRLCPIDPGHPHRYTSVGRWLFNATGLGLSVPWHKKNFLWSKRDFEDAIARTKYAGRCTVEAMQVANYPKVTASRGLKGAFARAYLSAVSAPWLRSSALCPILVVKLTLNG